MANLASQIVVSKVGRESPTRYRMRWTAPSNDGNRKLGEVVFDEVKDALEFDQFIGMTSAEARAIIEREARAFYKTICEHEARLAKQQQQ